VKSDEKIELDLDKEIVFQVFGDRRELHNELRAFHKRCYPAVRTLRAIVDFCREDEDVPEKIIRFSSTQVFSALQKDFLLGWTFHASIHDLSD
jgi:hypothetical protein